MLKMLGIENPPYAVLAIVAVLGFLATQLFAEVQTDRHAFAYRLDYDPDTRELLVEIENLSKTKSIRDGSFSLACKTPAPCFAERPTGFAIVRERSTIAVPSTEPVNTDREVMVVATVAPRARFAFGGQSLGGRDVADFSFESAAGTDSVNGVELGTLQAFYIRHYSTLLVASILVFVILLGVVLRYNYGARTPAKADSRGRPGEKEDALEKPDPSGAGSLPGTGGGRKRDGRGGGGAVQRKAPRRRG